MLHIKTSWFLWNNHDFACDPTHYDDKNNNAVLTQMNLRMHYLSIYVIGIFK